MTGGKESKFGIPLERAPEAAAVACRHGLRVVGLHQHIGSGVEAHVFAGTDSGFNQLIRPALYDAFHALENLSNPDGPLRWYDVVGNVCESGDLFARQRDVQALRRGDVLAVLGAGAYGMSMASTYNLRPLPAEVLVGTSGAARVVRERLTAVRRSPRPSVRARRKADPRSASDS